MGNEKNDTTESIIDSLEDKLGLREKLSEEGVVSKEEPKEEPKSTDTQLVTSEQITINKEITKLDMQIEELEKKSVNIDDFYSTLDDTLSEEEQALEFRDKAAYMKLVASKAKEFESKNTNSDALQKLKDEKKELEGIYERQSAIVEVSTKYPHYNHEETMKFFQNDLTKKQQDEIFSSSKSYADVYEKTHKKLLEANPKNITTTQAPNIPNVNNVRRESVNNKHTQNAFVSHDEQLRDALGF